MRFAPHSLLALLLAGPVLAAKRPPALPPLPVLELSGAAPVIAALIAGQPVLLTVDFGGDPFVQLSPAAVARLNLAAQTRADGETVDRGRFRVAVGQASIAVAFTRETISIAGRCAPVQVLAPVAAPDGAAAGSDGVIGLGALPQDRVRLELRPQASQDRLVTVAAHVGDRSNSLSFNWPLPRNASIEVELHHLRPETVASVAAASPLAAAGEGKLSGPVRRVIIGFGVARPVRRLVLARPLVIAGVPLRTLDVRLFDWAGKAELPPDADASEGALVVGRLGRQNGWPILKLGRDVLGRCASIGWRRDSTDAQRGWFDIVC